MLKQKLEALACAALAYLMTALAALRDLAWFNRRMTARGVVAAVVFLAARYGFEISPDTQAGLTVVIALYLGLVGRDKQRKRTQ